MNHTIERLAQPRLPTRGRVKRGNSDHSLTQLVIRFCKNWLIVVHDTPRYVLTTGNSNAGSSGLFISPIAGSNRA